MQNAGAVIHALSAVGQERLRFGCGMLGDHHDVTRAIERHEGLAAQRVTFEHGDHERQITRLSAKQAEHGAAAFAGGVNAGQIVEVPVSTLSVRDCR